MGGVGAAGALPARVGVGMRVGVGWKAMGGGEESPPAQPASSGQRASKINVKKNRERVLSIFYSLEREREEEVGESSSSLSL